MLVLDETTSGLNQEVEERLLEALKREIPVVVVTSHRTTPAKYATKIIINNGNVAVLKPTQTHPA